MRHRLSGERWDLGRRSRAIGLGGAACLSLAATPACSTDVEEGSSFLTTAGEAGTTATGGMADLPGTGGSESGDGSGEGEWGSSDDEGEETGESGGEAGDESCGDGQIDQGEQCDGLNLNGFDCVQLGYGGGALLCDPVTCTYDTSDCLPDMGGTTG